MNEAHRRFQEWLAAGADGEPPRDLAVHASVCADCQRSIAALDRLAAIDPGRAPMPAARETVPEPQKGAVRMGRVVGAAAGVLFSAVILGIGASQLISLSRSGQIAQATPTPGQSLTNTPEPTLFATPVPTAEPTPIPTPIPTPEPTPPPPPGAPSAPRSLTATPSIGKIALAWLAPSSNGGSAVTRYDIYRDGAGSPFKSTTARSYSDTVGNGATHVYRVTAVNKAGSSAYSKAATGTTPNVPGTPGNPQATGGVGQITLTWTAPLANGSPITRYDIYRDGATTVTYTGDRPDLDRYAGSGGHRSHTYIIKAVNAVGCRASAEPTSAAESDATAATPTTTRRHRLPAIRRAHADTDARPTPTPTTDRQRQYRRLPRAHRPSTPTTGRCRATRDRQRRDGHDSTDDPGRTAIRRHRTPMTCLQRRGRQRRRSPVDSARLGMQLAAIRRLRAP